MGGAVRLVWNFVVLDDTFNASIVELTPKIDSRIDEEFIRKTSMMMFVTRGEGTLNATEPPRD